jgi:hypothetical protein
VCAPVASFSACCHIEVNGACCVFVRALWQLKRALKIGFVRDASGDLVAAGDDAATPILPDQFCKVDFSKIAWKEDGLNHGRPMFRAVGRVVSPDASPAPAPVAARRMSVAEQPVLLVALGAAVGVVALLAVQGLRARM